jgi:broad specificity phosphatase PhoE
LSKAGRKQSQRLAALLRDEPVTRILSSPYVRCLQTVEPLGAEKALPLEPAEALAEGASVQDALFLIDEVAGEKTVLCTHGDVVSEVLSHFEALGVPLDELRFPKASTWVFDVECGAVIAGHYLPPARDD